MPDLNRQYTPRQQELLEQWRRGSLRRINILEGSVRSGKTHVSLALWALWVAGSPKEGLYLMAGRTLAVLERNILGPLAAMVGEENLSYSLSTKSGRLFGRKLCLEGAWDARSEGRIRGLTLWGAYCDELTLLDESFFAMLLSRLSPAGAKLIATTNPDSPRHWLMEHYLNRSEELDLMRMRFLLEDNTFLDKAYVEELKKEYTGVFYRRYVLGEWVAAQGAVYRQFADDPNRWLLDAKNHEAVAYRLADVDFVSVGVDFGGSRSLTTFVATAVHKGFSKLTVLADYHISGSKGEIDSQRVNREFTAFCQRLRQRFGLVPRYCFADSEAQYLINGLRRGVSAAGLGTAVGDCAKLPVFQRICCVNTLLATERLALLDDCSLLKRGLEEAVWDAEKSSHVRLDNFTSDIDILDAFEYSFERFMKQLTPHEQSR